MVQPIVRSVERSIMLLLDGSTSMLAILPFGMPGWAEALIIVVIGLLIFGRRLPDVGRSLGRSIVEFKRGVRGLQDEIESESKHGGGTGQLPDDPGQPISDTSTARAEAEPPTGGKSPF